MARKNRRSPRLREFDYREVGVYFITICTHDKVCIFGAVDLAEMVPSALGRVAETEWRRTLEARPYVGHDAFVVMPDHVHLLFGLWTHEDGDTRYRRDRAIPVPAIGSGGVIAGDRARPVPTSTSSPAHSVPAIIGGYKSAVTRHARRAGLWGDGPLWQGRYHDRVVRNERERDAFRDYIHDNPRKWFEDRYGPRS